MEILGNAGSGRESAHQLKVVGGLPVVPWAATANDLVVSHFGGHPAGGGLVKLQVEVCGAAVPFGDASCTMQTQSSWVDVTNDPGTPLVETISGLGTGLHRWRSRVLRARVGILAPFIDEPPVPAHGPWRRPHGQATEADVRLLPEPGLGAFVAGLALLARLRRRRAR